MADSNGDQKGLQIGSLLVALAGLVPFLVATTLFIAYLISEMNPQKPWLSAQFPPGPACFSLNDIKNGTVGATAGVSCSKKSQPGSCAQCVAVDFVTAQHIELANVIT